MRCHDRFHHIDLYPVLCADLSCGRSNETVLSALIAGGAKIVQYREKKSSKSLFYNEAKQLCAQAQAADMLFVVNDAVDVAVAIGADGVHLGQDDLPLSAARMLLGPDKIIGMSTHNVEEAVCADAAGASYINVGPIFPTQTKEGTVAAVGLAMFHKIKHRVSCPMTVMGGISHHNIDSVVAAGADKIAVVSAVVSAPDIARTVQDFRQCIGRI